jgi:hypothetical protein
MKQIDPPTVSSIINVTSSVLSNINTNILFIIVMILAFSKITVDRIFKNIFNATFQLFYLYKEVLKSREWALPLGRMMPR